MNREIFKKGGAWDHFSGKDHVMQFTEAQKMNNAIREEISKHIGEEIPKYAEGVFKKIYDAYNNLSKGEGFTRKDSRTGQ